jgi:amidase
MDMLERNAENENPRLTYKVISSTFNDKEYIWAEAQKQLEEFGEEQYLALYDIIFEKSINDIQQAISQNQLTYENLTKWYIFRILKFEKNPKTSLHAIISLNPNAVKKAKVLDKNKGSNDHKIYGMPILLKDNIGAEGMPTTAGAIALSNNFTRDAKIVENLKSKDAIILGKVNLSEWAYFFCSGCPLGYSALGGQTLNPFGRGIFETGGSSSGSGVAVAANYAVAAVGTETSGSILSPSSQNSIVGLKPTIGVLSRSGIVPISSTLDTPGPMTKNVSDSAILLSAMAGKDKEDSSTLRAPDAINYNVDNLRASIALFSFGVNKKYLEASPEYKSMVEKLKDLGAKIVEFDPLETKLDGFVDVLHYDMKKDLPKYLSSYAPRSVQVRSVKDIISFNNENMELRAPYGQELFIKTDSCEITLDSINRIKMTLQENARLHFKELLEEEKVDAILSINNYDAGYAAMAKYPALAIPMGKDVGGEPKALTLIALPFHEQELLNIGKTIMDSFNLKLIFIN